MCKLNEVEIELLAQDFINNNLTVRKAGEIHKISKSSVHIYLTKKLAEINPQLAKQVAIILEKNFKEKHIRGGESTKKKYKHILN